MPFLDPLHHRWVEPGEAEYRDGRDWMLLSPIRYHWTRMDIILTAEEGFVYDQASVPRLVLPVIVESSGKISKPSVFHDLLYNIYRDLNFPTSCHPKVTSDHDWTKSETDLMFRDGMIDNGMSKIRAYIAWLGVKANLNAKLNWNTYV